MTDRISSRSFEVLEQYRQSRKPGETKKIVVCFDGTGGEPEWAVQNDQERGKVERYQSKCRLSNICKVHLFAGGTVDNSACAIDGQVSLYYKGVGTWAEPGLKVSYRVAFGDGAMHDIYIRAYADETANFARSGCAVLLSPNAFFLNTKSRPRKLLYDEISARKIFARVSLSIVLGNSLSKPRASRNDSKVKPMSPAIPTPNNGRMAMGRRLFEAVTRQFKKRDALQWWYLR